MFFRLSLMLDHHGQKLQREDRELARESKDLCKDYSGLEVEESKVLFDTEVQ